MQESPIQESGIQDLARRTPAALAWRALGSVSFVLAVRWLFFLALAGSLFFTDRVLLPVLSWQLQMLLLTLLLVNLLLSGLSYWRPRLVGFKKAGLKTFGLKEIGLVTDIALLTAIVYFSGGVMNPAVALYLFPLLIGALTCSTAFAWGCVVMAMTCYLGLFYWYVPLASLQHGAHVEHASSGSELLQSFNLHLLGMWLVFSLSAVLITASVSWLMRILRKKEQQLQLAYQKQQEQEQFLLLGLESASIAHQLSTPLNNLFLLSEELSAEPELSPDGQHHIRLLHQQLVLCRDVLWQLKHSAESGMKPVYFYQQLQAYLARWTNLRPDVRCIWTPPPAQQEVCVWLDDLFWSALLNIMDNAADAGDNRVELLTEIVTDVDKGRVLYLDIYNRQGHLSDEQLAQAGLNQQASEKTSGLGIGVWLAHATFSRLKGSLTLQNHTAGGVHAHIQLPLHTVPSGVNASCPLP